MKKFITVLVIISFFSTCTNLIPICALVSPIGLFLFPISLRFERKIPVFLFYLYAFFLISIISVLLYDPKALISYGFYRYDGNFIISYAPLFLIPLVSKKMDVTKLLINFLYFETIANSIAFIGMLAINRFHINADLSFGSFFIARNAAGGFFSFCITVIFIIYWKNKTWKNFLLLALNVFFLTATYSRGSILGFLFCAGLYLLSEKHMGKIAIIIIIVLLGFEAFLVSKTFDIYKKASSQYNGYGYVAESIKNDDTKGGNITIRLLFAWPSGIDEFMHSPLFGAGFGSINDRPYIFDDDIGIVNPNKQGVKVYSDAHAHNTYFHIGGEQGLLGLYCFFGFIISSYMYFYKLKKDDKKHSLVINSIILYLMNIAFMSLTEHRLTTPSNVLPLTLLVVLFFAQYNYDNFIKKQLISTKAVVAI